MNLQSKRLLLAPVLAIALAVLLAGTVYHLPFSPQSNQGQPSPEPTIAPNTPIPSSATPIPTAIPTSVPTPAATSAPATSQPTQAQTSQPTPPSVIPTPEVTPASSFPVPSVTRLNPTQKPAATSTESTTPAATSSSQASEYAQPVLLAVAAVVVGVVTGYLFFSEKSLNKKEE